MKMSMNNGVGTFAMAALALSMMASAPAEAKGKTGWIKCCDANGDRYEVPEGTPGAVADTGNAGAPAGAVARNKTGWIILTVAGIAAVGGIVAATGGGSPKSP
jgi:hypothetical protein